MIKALLFIAVLLSFSSQTLAQSKAQVEVELLSQNQSIQPGKTALLGLHFVPKNKWHFYWRNPGDSGLSTQMKWNLPEGFEAGEIQWPFPERIDVPPLVNYGYHEETLLLVEIKVPETLNSQEIVLGGKVRWLECKDVCIPRRKNLSITLPVTNSSPSLVESWKTLFEDQIKRVPEPTQDLKLALVEEGDKFKLSIRPKSTPSPLDGWTQNIRLEFFSYDGEQFDHAYRQDLVRTTDGFELTLKKSETLEKKINFIEGVLVTDESFSSNQRVQAVEISVAVGSEGNILKFLLFAFLGGLILNLMPCVFPVISIKILSFVQQSHGNRRAIAEHGLAFSTGLLLSFWIIAGILLGLRAGGEALGWGFQLQSPLFLFGLTSIFSLMALNLFGVFEIQLAGIQMGNQIKNETRFQKLFSSFSGGALAVVVASPCTAPFMAPALGFALSQASWVALGIFTSLALGMALPYLLLAVFPVWLKWLPKPGAWMVVFRQSMGFLMLATAVWLIWVFGLQMGMDLVARLLFTLVLLGVGAWLWGVAQRNRKLWVKFLAVAVGLGAVFSFSIQLIQTPSSLEAVSANEKDSTYGVRWQEWSPEKVFELRQAGKTIYVDFTAAWCITCQVNKRVVFSSQEVLDTIEKNEVVMLKADWTKRDDRIANELAQYGRAGVPLNLVYYKGGDPKILPEVLSPSIALEALQGK